MGYIGVPLVSDSSLEWLPQLINISLNINDYLSFKFTNVKPNIGVIKSVQ